MRRRADIAEVLRLADEFHIRRAGVVTARGNGDGGQIVFSIWQCEAVAERAVGTQFDLVAAERDFRAGFGCAVDDELGVDVEPEAF